MYNIPDNIQVKEEDILKHLEDIRTDLEFQADVNDPSHQDTTDSAQLARETRQDILTKLRVLQIVYGKLGFSA